jgi:hypothetical protein
MPESNWDILRPIWWPWFLLWLLILVVFILMETWGFFFKKGAGLYGHGDLQ